MELQIRKEKEESGGRIQNGGVSCWIGRRDLAAATEGQSERKDVSS